MEQLKATVKQCMERIQKLENMMTAHTRPTRKDHLHMALLNGIFREGKADKMHVVIGVTQHETDQVQEADATLNKEVIDDELIDMAESLAIEYELTFTFDSPYLYFEFQ